MAKSVFIRLAKNNILRDKKMYVPYFVASSVMIAVYFMVLMLINSDSISNLPSGDSLQSMFVMCSQIMVIIVVPFMLYVNSFLIKERKKEFALYGILGLEKRHVARVIILENIFLNLSSLAMGIITGCVFGKLIFLLLMRFFGEMAQGTAFSLPPEAFSKTLLLFVIIFVICTVYNLCHVSLAKPVDLIKGKEKGEKKPRFVFPLTIIGLAVLAWSYYTALTSEPAFDAINKFFSASTGVIVATYLLFISGSVFFIRFLKNRRNFYYKPGNFITLGSLTHRMKQNAAGLATICILSTMVICTVAITASIYLGQDDLVRQNNPTDVSFSLPNALSQESQGQMADSITALAQANSVKVTDYNSYPLLLTTQVYSQGRLQPFEVTKGTPKDYNNRYEVAVITASDYTNVTGSPLSLGQGEIVALSNDDIDDIQELKSVESDGVTYKVIKAQKDTPFTLGKNATLDKTIFLVAPDDPSAAALFRGLAQEPVSELPYETYTTFNLQGAENNCLAFTAQLKENLDQNTETTNYSDIYHTRIEGYGLFGGLLFLGVFLSIVFLTVAILIIYFKQVSEGYEDKARFDILQKVGMSQKEVKSTINKQIILVFFLPLITALIHTTVAVKVMTNMLASIYLTNNTLTILCIGATAGAFALVYVVVYRLTARTYYKIVSPGLSAQTR